MLDLANDIHSLTDFKCNTTDFVRRRKKTGNPLILTVNGKAELIVQDAKSYQKLLEMIDRVEEIEGIRRDLESMKRGHGRPARDVFDALRKKYRIPRST